MTDTLTPEGETPAETENRNLARLRELAAKGEKADELQATLDQRDRELAVIKSGIDADTPLGKMFLKSYEGDINDVEGLVAQAKEIGIPFKAGSESTEIEVSEPNGTEIRQQLAAEAPADTNVKPDPNETALNAFTQAMKDGKTWEAGAADMVGTLAQAAIDGDTRVIQQ